MVRLVIEEDTVYEIDEECLMRKEALEEAKARSLEREKGKAKDAKEEKGDSHRQKSMHA